MEITYVLHIVTQTSVPYRMELRKVQLTGGSSITVTLPKTWVEKSKILAGDVVGCVEQPDGSLNITPHIKGERPNQQYTIEIQDAEGNYLFRKIIAAYLTGYDTIRLTSKGPIGTGARQAIRLAVRRIMGLEIVDEQPSSITLQDFLDPREFHIEKALRRMGILTQAMQEEALTALRNPKPELAQSANERDDEVDRLFWLVNKQYHAILRDASYAAKMGLSAGQSLNFVLGARLVERTADHAGRIAREAVQLPPGKVPDAFLQRLEKQGRRAVELFQLALQMFFRKDAEKANQVIEDAQKFLEAQKKMLKDASELGGEPLYHVTFILESISRTAAYAADVGEVALNHKVASP
jgi:phosphate uptake regulator